MITQQPIIVANPCKSTESKAGSSKAFGLRVEIENSNIARLSNNSKVEKANSFSSKRQ